GGVQVASTFNNGVLTVNDTQASGGKVGYWIRGTSLTGKNARELFVPVWIRATDFDWRDAVMYFTFTDRFLDGDPSNNRPAGADVDWAGGDFAGLRQKVEEGYFEALGVNTLWLSSVSMNMQTKGDADGRTMSAYHSYWPVTTGWTDETASMFESYTSNGVRLTAIEPQFGTMEELRALIKACHDRGIRVLVDYAANHVHTDSPLYIRHKDNGWFNLSPMRLCNDGNWDLHPITCWFAEYLPDINYDNDDARKLMVDHALWLIRETNIDGFRMDAVKHMPDQFLIDLRTSIDALIAGSGEMFYMVGETFTFDKNLLKHYINPMMLHGQFDFPFYGEILSKILKGEGNYYDIKDFVQHNDSEYGDALMGTFIGNHDVARAISVANGDSEAKWVQNPQVYNDEAYLKLKLAWTVLLTSPGIPLVYYGDEFGLEGGNDPDNRRMMKFGDALTAQQKETLGFVQLLGQVRRAHPVFSRGTRTNIDAYEKSWMYTMSDGRDTILVGVSGTGAEQTYTVPVGSRGWVNLLNPGEVISETTTVTMRPGRQIIVWKLK
ncbi:MAG: alpha-amylase family glycosyl hydrolase, partial [Proteobacteria bacterium]|nr:alpha-amylase family glycosyl hydrolase [Pseudomonadota bacterium]